MPTLTEILAVLALALTLSACETVDENGYSRHDDSPYDYQSHSE